jgi:hypothetical protein
MTNLRSTLAALTLAFIPSIACAEASEPVTFTYRGEPYTYTVEQGQSFKILRGKAGKSAEPFEFKVGKRRVDGTIGGRDVSFMLSSVKKVKGIVTVEQMASR